MRKKTKIVIVAVLLILVTTPFIGYFMATSSEPFQHTKNAIQASPSIKEVVGDIQTVKLAPFGYSVKYSGPQGWANFETDVVGTKGSGTLFVKLEKNLGAWQFTGAKLNGKDISL